MNTITTVVLAAVVFGLVGTLVFAAIVPSLSEVDAKRDANRDMMKTCPLSSPNAVFPPPCGIRLKP